MKKYYIWRSSGKVLDYYWNDQSMVKVIKYLPYECLGYLEGAEEICSFFLIRNVSMINLSNYKVQNNFDLPNNGEKFKTLNLKILDMYVIKDENGNIRDLTDFTQILRDRSPRKRRCSMSKSWKDQTKRRFQWKERLVK